MTIARTVRLSWLLAAAAATTFTPLTRRALDAQTRPVAPRPTEPRPATPRTPPAPRPSAPPRAEAPARGSRSEPAGLFEGLARLESLSAIAPAMATTLSSDMSFAIDQAMHAAAPSIAFAQTFATTELNASLSSASAALAATMSSLDAGRLADIAQLGADSRWMDAQIASGISRGLSTTAARYRTEAPEAWNAEDPADSLYREARKALSNDSYRRAAELFRRIRDQYPKSTYTPDAPYWEAFALQRLGTPSDLRAAQEALAWQERQFPKAPTRTDASALATRVEGALARRGDASAAATLYGRAESASNDGCPKQSDDERVDALNALIQVDAERALPILRKVLARREPCTQNMRRTAVYLIASRKAPDAADVLMNVAKTDPDKEVREQAVFWLSNVPTEEAAGMLVDLAKGNGDLDLRKRAVYALSRSKSAKAAGTLREIAADANAPEELRGDALQWYMSGPGKSMEDPMPFLKDVYGKADEPRFRQRVMYLIAQRKSEASREFMMSIAQNSKESMETRRNVVGLFSVMGVSSSEIGALYERTSETELKQMLLSQLGSQSRNEDIEPLLKIARAEKNLNLRRQAISQLSRSKDPRALQFLQEIIER